MAGVEAVFLAAADFEATLAVVAADFLAAAALTDLALTDPAPFDTVAPTPSREPLRWPIMAIPSFHDLVINATNVGEDRCLRRLRQVGAP